MTIASTVRSMVPDTWFGVGLHRDFPDNPYGNVADGFFTTEDDVPYRNLQDETSDLSLVNAALMLGSGGGNDTPESQIESLYLTATGMGLVYPTDTASASIPPKVCVASPDDPAPPRGYPCFRPGALPIVVLVTDADFHNGVTPGDEYAGPVASVAHTNADAVTALSNIGARFIGVNLGAARPDMEFIANGTGSIGSTLECSSLRQTSTSGPAALRSRKRSRRNR